MLGIGGGRATDGNGGLSESGPAENRALQVQDPRFMLITEHYNIPGGAVGTETIGSPAGGLPPEESFGGGASTSAIGGLDGCEALGGGALPGL